MNKNPIKEGLQILALHDQVITRKMATNSVKRSAVNTDGSLGDGVANYTELESLEVLVGNYWTPEGVCGDANSRYAIKAGYKILVPKSCFVEAWNKQEFALPQIEGKVIFVPLSAVKAVVC